MKERRQIGGITKEAFLALVAKEGGVDRIEDLEDQPLRSFTGFKVTNKNKQ